MHRCVVALASAGALAACGSDGGQNPDPGLPTAPPTSVSMVSSADGFDSPMDAVASLDGETFYFTAHVTASGEAGIFEVPAAGGAAKSLVAGDPLEDPSGLLLSCDGATLFVSDLSYAAGDLDPDLDAGKAPIYTLDLSSNALVELPTSGIGEAAGLAMGPDCENLYVSGYTEDGTPALFRLPAAGGAATVVKKGSPLESPSGVFVDSSSVAWVMDQLPSNLAGGVLYAIDPEGNTDVVVGNLEISEPAGVSLVAGGGTAVIPARDPDGGGQLVTVEIESGDTTIVESNMLSPAGIRTARKAGVFAVVDADGDAIYRAE